MPNTKNLKLGEKYMALWIGPNGKRKTTSAASFHLSKNRRNRKIMFFDFDRRMDPIKLIYPDADIEYETYGPYNLDKFDRDLRSVFKSQHEFYLLVFDSFTSMALTSVTYQMQMKGALAPGEVTGNLSKGGVMVPGWDEWKGEAMQLSQVIDNAKAINCHVIFTAHPVSKIVIEPKTLKVSRIQTITTFGSKAAEIVPGFFNEIYEFEEVRSIDMDKPGKLVASISKTALPGMPGEIAIDKPFWEKLNEILEPQGINL